MYPYHDSHHPDGYLGPDLDSSVYHHSPPHDDEEAPSITATALVIFGFIAAILILAAIFGPGLSAIYG